MNEMNCGCCEGIEKKTPQAVENRPGLSALRYRVGTYGTFLDTMLASMSNRNYPALNNLKTRETRDPAIALLDAGAVMFDVLTFYQERIANEGYLRTATERRSILELARLIGYKLRPGVAASVFLAFTLENGYETEIPVGTRAQSIPAPGELPQAFETSEPLLARADWNTLQLRMTQPSYIVLENAPGLETLYFQGIATNLKPNDSLLLVFSSEAGGQVLHFVESVEANTAGNYTTVVLQKPNELAREELVNSVRGTMNKFLNLEAFGVSEGTQMARRVTALLRDLNQKLSARMHAVKLAALLEEILPALREEHAAAIEGGFARLEPWVGEMVKSLEAIDAEFSEGMGRSALLATRSDARTGQKRSSAISGLGDLLPSLLVPPSLQPRNAWRLARDYKTLFASQADTLPRLLTAIQPRLKGVLYQAWARAQVTQDTLLQSVNVLRIKAAPFGHNAPLRTIQDDNGVIVGQEEWPIETAQVTIQLSTAEGNVDLFSSFSEDIVNALLKVGQGLDVLSWIQKIERSGSETSQLIDVALGDELPVRIVIEYSNGIDIGTITKFSVHLLNKQIRLDNMGSTLDVYFDGNLVKNAMSSGAHFEGFSDKLKVIIDFSQNGEQCTIQAIGIPAPPLAGQKSIITLDAEYDQIIPGSWVIIDRADWPEPRPFTVIEVRTVSKAAYGISAKATQLTLNEDWLTQADVSLSVYRNTTVYARSEPLAMADEPITEEIYGATLELGALYNEIETGRWIIVTGERTDIPNTTGVKASELVMLSGVTQGVAQVDSGDGVLIDLPGDKIHTTLQVANDLAYKYKRDTVTIYGNVVKATHGETRREVLGTGDASKEFQAFTLKQSPLTFVSSPTPSGIESTLEVRVNDILWPEVDGLVWLGANDRGYETKTDDDSKTTVIFGDGQHGTRLPTGTENIRARYRFGIGKPGNVRARQVSLLATKPLGVKSVINPLPATGGADREDRDLARANAPLAVMALDRLVSVQDYADFARTFAGVGKASAVRLSDGRRELVHVTIAGVDNIPIAETSDLFRNLRLAFSRFNGDPFQPVMLVVRSLKLLVIAASVRLLAEYEWESVEPKIRQALLDAFSFARRALGEDVVSSQVISTIQSVAGVAYVDLDVLDTVDEDSDLSDLENLASTLALRDRIPVYLARLDTSTNTLPRSILPAQLCFLNPEIPDTLILKELPR